MTCSRCGFDIEDGDPRYCGAHDGFCLKAAQRAVKRRDAEIVRLKALCAEAADAADAAMRSSGICSGCLAHIQNGDYHAENCLVPRLRAAANADGGKGSEVQNGE